MKFSDLIGPTSNWRTVDVFPSSIPHLFHHDLSFLWVLEKDIAVRPAGWDAKLQLWARLLHLLLIGELEVVPEAIQVPLRNYAAPLGAETLSWLTHKGELVGVVSPTVIVRPLPDLDCAAVLARLPNPLAGDNSSNLSLLMQVLVQRLAAHPGHPAALAHLIENNAGVPALVGAGVGVGMTTSSVNVAVWRQVDETVWSRPAFVTVSVPCFAKVGVRLFKPRCDGCSAVLLRASDEATTIEGASDSFILQCAKCNAQNVVKLESLYVHNDSKSGVTVWTDRAERTANAEEWPPPARLEGHDAVFEWDVVDAGQQNDRFLRIRFPGKQISLRGVADVFFKKLLVLDGTVDYLVAVRPEWFHLCVQAGRAVESGPDRVRFAGLSMKGIPLPFEWTFLGPTLEKRSETALTIFPRRLPSYWRQYRIASAGQGSQDLQIQIDGGQGTGRLDVVTGWPPVVWLTTDGGSTGVGFNTKLVADPIEPTGSVECRMAIDFGTSSTVVSAALGADGPGTFLEPARLREAMFTLAGPSAAIPSYLPDGAWSASADDAALFPSALRRPAGGPGSLIRWSGQNNDGATRHGFKWDSSHAGERSQERQEYLAELLFLCVPATLVSKDVQQRPSFRIGFAFPLAFDASRRLGFNEDLVAACNRINGSDPSLTVTVATLNESLAAVQAFGGLNPGDTYLLADLGGGSLDIAVFTKGNGEEDFDFHQVGSYRFGGEQFLACVARHIGVNAVGDSNYWKARDALVTGSAASQYTGQLPVFHKAARGFLPLALEIIRVIAATHSHRHAQDRIRYLLVGNGWRAAQFKSNGQCSILEAASSVQELCDLLGVSKFEPAGPPAPHPKRFVSTGVMKVLRQGYASNELKDSESGDRSKMAAGIGMSMEDPVTNAKQHILWHTIIGSAGEKVNTSGKPAKALRINFDTSAMPSRSHEWNGIVESGLAISGLGQHQWPTQSEFLEHMPGALDGRILRRGPFQIVVEEHWRPALESGR